MQGTVKFYNETKGFGFIARDDGLADVFAHVSALVDRYGGIKEGDRVSFDLGEHRGRPCAEVVRVIESSPVGSLRQRQSDTRYSREVTRTGGW